MTDILAAALEYARSGKTVFPCHRETKRPLIKGWRDNATADAATIAQQWKSFPGAMIGIPTGEAVDAFVVDIDAGVDKATGEVFEAADLVAQLESKIGCQLPATLTSETPRGGLHIWFLLPQDEKIGNRAGIIPRIDVRGTGGYVIAPPSVRSDGKSYVCKNPDIDIASAPKALIDLILRRGAFGSKSSGSLSQGNARYDASDAHRKYALSALDRECAAIKNAASGQRNTALHNAAANIAEFVAAGVLDEHAALAAIRGSASANPGADTSSQIEATIKSGWGKGIANPRDLSNVALDARPRSQNSRSSSQPYRKQSMHTAPEDIEALHLQCCRFPMTDMGNAERFAARNRHRVRWVDKSELWSIYDGRRWTIEGGEAVVEQWVYETVRAIAEEARSMRDSGRRDLGVAGALDDLVEEKDGEEILVSDLLAKWAVKSEAHGKFSRIKASARPLGLTIQPEDFDRDPFLINCENGTLQLLDAADANSHRAKVHMRPHDPSDLIIPTCNDHNPLAHLRCPMVIMRQG